METKKSKLVDGLTMNRINRYDRHVAMSELNRHTRRCRIERMKEVVWYFVPYVVAGVLILTIMSIGG